MSRHDEAGARESSPLEPNGELLLAQALEASIRAERALPGSSADVIAAAPAAARAELQQLVDLARRLEADVDGVAPSARFRSAARARLMQRIGGQPVSSIRHIAPHLARVPGSTRPGRRHWRWIVRGSAGLAAALLATTATLTASASALPGDVLYGLKQAQEELNLRLASDDQARVLAHLHRADARLDETARLLEQGRTSEAVMAAQRYDQSVERATTTFVVTVDAEPNASRAEHIETALSQQQQRLETILRSAPEPARSDLREALATTERGRELMADPRSIERALGLRQARPASVAAPLAAPEPEPTSRAEEPTPAPTVPPSRLALPTPTIAAVLARANDDDRSGSGRAGGSSSSRTREHETDGERGQLALDPKVQNNGGRQPRSGPNAGGDGSQPERGRSGQTAAPSSSTERDQDDRDAVAVQPSQGSPTRGASDSSANRGANSGGGARSAGGEDRARTVGSRDGSAVNGSSAGGGDQSDDRPRGNDDSGPNNGNDEAENRARSAGASSVGGGPDIRSRPGGGPGGVARDSAGRNDGSGRDGNDAGGNDDGDAPVTTRSNLTVPSSSVEARSNGRGPSQPESAINSDDGAGAARQSPARPGSSSTAVGANGAATVPRRTATPTLTPTPTAMPTARRSGNDQRSGDTRSGNGDGKQEDSRRGGGGGGGDGSD